jgi:hypothetical protein
MRQPAQPELFNPPCDVVITELSGDGFLALCDNPGWSIKWFQRVGNAGWRVKAVRVCANAEDNAVRLPYKD